MQKKRKHQSNCSKTVIKKKIIKAVRNKARDMYGGANVRITADLS